MKKKNIHHLAGKLNMMKSIPIIIKNMKIMILWPSPLKIQKICLTTRPPFFINKRYSKTRLSLRAEGGRGGYRIANINFFFFFFIFFFFFFCFSMTFISYLFYGDREVPNVQKIRGHSSLPTDLLTYSNA